MTTSLDSRTRLRQVGNDELIGEEPVRSSQPSPALAALTSAATDAVFLALRALSQRTLVALSSLFTLLTAGSVWYLWLQVLPSPTTAQLEAAGAYSVFVLFLHLIRGR